MEKIDFAMFRLGYESLLARTKIEVMRFNFYWRTFTNNCPISAVAIEINTHCHRRCSYCPVSSEPKPRILMSRGLFEEIISQLCDCKFSGRLMYHFYNEPLLRRDLEYLVSYAKKFLPKVKLVIYTSGDQLSRSRANSLFQAGVDQFVVTDHGRKALTPPVEEAARKWPVFRRKIRYRSFTDESKLFNRGGLILVKNQRRFSYCAYPAFEVVIDVNGNVLLCCNDFLGKYKFGNITDVSLINIWNSKEMTSVRRDLLTGNFNLNICQKCVGIDKREIDV